MQRLLNRPTGSLKEGQAMDFRWVVGLTLWTMLSGPILVQPRASFMPANPLPSPTVSGR